MSRATLQLAPRLDLRAAGTLAEDLLAHRGADLALDAGEVSQMGALAVQAIQSAAQSWATDGHVLALENASTDVVDQLVLLGFSPDSVTKWEVQP